MKKIIATLFMVLVTAVSYAAPPSRVSTYTAGTTIRASAVTENEDALFNYVQSGVDTFADDSIYNEDINSAAAILASKLNLTSISQNITHTGTFTQGSSSSFTTITDLGTVATGVITAIDLNGGTIDGTAIGSSSANTGKFTTLEATSTLKLGTTNQGDILYDNGTSLVRLTPGTSGQFLKTQGTSANPAWANPGTSNVIFQWNGTDASATNTYGIYNGALSKDFSSYTAEYLYIGAYGTTYRTVLVGKFIKVAGISTITVNARLGANNAAGDTEPILNVDVGGQSTTVTVAGGTIDWATASTIDVSSLTTGTTYDITIQLKNESATTTSYLSAVLLTGS